MKKPTIVPFVKWVGGKRQLLKDLFSVMEDIDYKEYHEPFVGGGALFIGLLNKGEKVASINDFNSELVNCYETIRDDVDSLIDELKKFENNHTRFSYYIARYLDRSKDFKKLSKVKRAARFIYLNKTSFNGVYRVNSKGHHNVPIGSLWGTKIFDEANIRNLSEKFKEVQIHNSDYQYVYEIAKPGDLVYFDPPYDKFEDKENFVGYQKEGFDRGNQNQLKELCDRLIDKGVNVIVSNHNTKFIQELYGDDKYYKKLPVKASRVLNSKASQRKKEDIEVIIYGGWDVKK